MSRDPARIPQILSLLRKVWEEHPDWRLGQLVENATRPSADPFYIEDTEMSLGLLSLLREPDPSWSTDTEGYIVAPLENRGTLDAD